MSKKNISWVVVIIVTIILIVYFFQTDSNDDTIKIGVIAPTSGPIASFGKYIVNGLSIGKDEINLEGGINGRSIELIFEDEGGGVNAAVTSFRKLVDLDKVKVIIGPATSNGVMALAPLANKEKIIIISPSATTDNITSAGDYIFRTRASTSDEVKVFINYILENYELKSFAALRSSADYAVSFIQISKDEIIKKKCEFLTEESFPPNTVDYRTQLTLIKKMNPDGLFIVGVPIELGNMMKQIKQLGINAKIFSNQIDNPEIFEFAGDAANGIIFPTTFYDPLNGYSIQRKFEEAYENKFGNNSHLFAANAYDALFAVKRVIEKNGYESEEIKNGLYAMSPFQGASGKISFDKNGDLISPIIAIKTIKQGKFEFIKEVTK